MRTGMITQSRFEDKSLKFQVVRPQNGTAVLKRLAPTLASAISRGVSILFLSLREPLVWAWGTSGPFKMPSRHWVPRHCFPYVLELAALFCTGICFFSPIIVAFFTPPVLRPQAGLQGNELPGILLWCGNFIIINRNMLVNF